MTAETKTNTLLSTVVTAGHTLPRGAQGRAIRLGAAGGSVMTLMELLKLNMHVGWGVSCAGGCACTAVSSAVILPPVAPAHALTGTGTGPGLSHGPHTAMHVQGRGKWSRDSCG